MGGTGKWWQEGRLGGSEKRHPSVLLKLCHMWTSSSRHGHSSADMSLRRKLLKKSMESCCFYRATPVSLQPHFTYWLGATAGPEDLDMDWKSENELESTRWFLFCVSFTISGPKDLQREIAAASLLSSFCKSNLTPYYRLLVSAAPVNQVDTMQTAI